ncbi:MAG: hypothetical protein KIS81_00675 [Maricaulaceae bacterium]|nr:hypothetical protein [Maricaulaceae bacterium]
MPVFDFTGRPPREALEALRARLPGGRLSFDWRDVWQDEHLSSFVVAKMMSADLLRDVHGALERALEEGWTRERFAKELRPMLAGAGWWGRRTMTDPLTGESREVQLGSARRVDIIFDANIRQSHAAGRWQRIQAAKEALPYLVYTIVDDERTRDEHAAWGGRGAARIVLPVDHPFWLTHYPPNGWRCRCTVLQVDGEWLAAHGLEVSTGEELEAAGWGRTRPWLNRRTGEVIEVPANIDPGWAHNPGAARRAMLAPPPVAEPVRDNIIGGRWPRALPPAPQPRPFPDGVARRPGLTDPDAVFDAFRRQLGVEEGGVFIDRAQIPLVVERGLFQARAPGGRVLGAKAAKFERGEWAQLLAATVRDPDEIWVAAQRMPGGDVRLARHYVAAWNDPEGRRFWFTAVFVEGAGWWHGVTAYPPGKPGRPGQQARLTDRNFRNGTLVWSRGRS